MADAAPPSLEQGEVFLDARGSGRALRLSWHPEADVVVLSLWREGICAGTFRMPHEDVAAFVDALVDGLREQRRPASGRHRPGLADGPVPTTEPSMPAIAGTSSFLDWAFSDPADTQHSAAG